MNYDVEIIEIKPFISDTMEAFVDVRLGILIIPNSDQPVIHKDGQGADMTREAL